jgi:hypothetical protein
VIATRSRETDRYSITYVLLTTPTMHGEKINVAIHRSTGTLIFRGTARARGDRIDYSIRAVAKPGARPVTVEASMRGGELVVKSALAGQLRQGGASPSRIPRRRQSNSLAT